MKNTKITTYATKKAVARQEAIDWQNDFGNHNYSYGELVEFGEHFEKLGRRQATKEETVINEIINFFVDKFETGEMMDAFEKSLGKQEICSRKKNIYLEFWTYAPGGSETHFGLLGKEWKPENSCCYEHNGVDLKNIYKDVLLEIAELTRENFEEEGFKVEIKNERCDTHVIEISW